jgi:hypothetical protein
MGEFAIGTAQFAVRTNESVLPQQAGGTLPFDVDWARNSICAGTPKACRLERSRETFTSFPTERNTHLVSARCDATRATRLVMNLN